MLFLQNLLNINQPLLFKIYYFYMKFFRLFLLWILEFGVLYLVYFFSAGYVETAPELRFWFSVFVACGFVAYFISIYTDLQEYYEDRLRENFLRRKFSSR